MKCTQTKSCIYIYIGDGKRILKYIVFQANSYTCPHNTIPSLAIGCGFKSGGSLLDPSSLKTDNIHNMLYRQVLMSMY